MPPYTPPTKPLSVQEQDMCWSKVGLADTNRQIWTGALTVAVFIWPPVLFLSILNHCRLVSAFIILPRPLLGHLWGLIKKELTVNGEVLEWKIQTLCYLPETPTNMFKIFTRGNMLVASMSHLLHITAIVNIFFFRQDRKVRGSWEGLLGVWDKMLSNIIILPVCKRLTKPCSTLIKTLRQPSLKKMI